MCGIAGIYNCHSNTVPIDTSIKKMLSLIKHRGPDESGIYLNHNVALGSVRLSIVDLLSGSQPLSDESENYWIVYNGEIFNYLELRKDLLKKGINLKTHCDTEVVVQMFALYGEECLNRFNGQFAFCIWDKKKQQLFLARDRVGIRPLFYWSNNGAFAFCSEIKGLFSLDWVNKALDAKSISDIFTYWTTITPNTPFQGIKELQPGHYMYVNADGMAIKRYWQLNFSADKKDWQNRDIKETTQELHDLLLDSVRIRLRADVPVGAYLSGGLDSSITTSFIKEIAPTVLNTFSIGFNDKSFDETAYQLEAARYFNTNHTAITCTAEDIAENFAQTIWHSEYPILRTSPTPMFLLSNKVRENNIKVVMTGEGADEFLAGYNIFKEAKIRRFWAKFPNSKIRPKLLAKLYPYIPNISESSDLALKMFFGYKLSEINHPLYSHLLRWNNTSRIKSFFSEDFGSFNGQQTFEDVMDLIPESFDSWSDLAKSQYLEATIFMSGYLLSSQGDRMAMGNSVEGRYPFLDYRVIEFCAKLPDNYKLNSLNEKFILKKMSQGRVPDSIAKRPKQAYRAPIAATFCNEKAPDYISEMLSEEKIKSYGIFDPTKVKNLIINTRKQSIISEIDQMAITGILSTQLLQLMFVNNYINTDVSKLNNLKVIYDTENSVV